MTARSSKVFIALTALLFVSVVACQTAPARQATGIYEIDFTAWQWGYDPGLLTVPSGSTVRLNVHSLDVAHTLTNDELGIDAYIPPRGEGPREVAFTVRMPGTFEFRCTADCGPGKGRQKFRLVVN